MADNEKDKAAPEESNETEDKTKYVQVRVGKLVGRVAINKGTGDPVEPGQVRKGIIREVTKLADEYTAG